MQPLINIPRVGSYPSIPLVPPTPAPRTVQDIQQDTRDRFAGLMWITKEEGHQVEDYLSEYDHYELYSETKWYSKRSYQAAYTGVLREYHNYLCVLEGTETTIHYVVAKHIRSELETLEKFCPCFSCSCSTINPLKYLWCPHCTRCIKAGAGFANPQYVETARKNKDLPRRYIKPMRYIEFGVVLLALIITYVMSL
jgi:hypothetical protein